MKKESPIPDIERRQIDAKLDTLISYDKTLSLKLDRFNQHLALSNEVMAELSETIKVHLALIKEIGEGTKETGKQFRKIVKFIEEATKKKKS